MKKNVFCIGLNDFNLGKLRTIRGAENYDFRGVIDPAAVLDTEVFDMKALIETARSDLHAFQGSVDAIVVYMDFPVSTMWPILCREFNLPSPTLESLLRCEHKYWSRLVMKECIPDHIPGFAAFDPFDEDPRRAIPFDYPFWVKPIKSSGSRLGFRVNNETDFHEAVRILRENIGLISEPFNHVLDQADLPDEVRRVHGGYCLAEQIIGGRQCTLEGYVYGGRPRVYGVVDSIRHKNKVSFLRYQYPSRLPVEVRRRMVAITRTVMRHIGFDNSPFNVEFFWDTRRDHLWLLEINTRLSQSHCDLFEKVDGRSHQEVAVDIALGNAPQWERRKGEYKVAAHFFHRRFEDAIVTRVPSEARVREIEAKYPGTIIRPQIQEGMRLSELPEQDSYSFAVAQLDMGAGNQKRLLSNYRRVRRELGFEYRSIETVDHPETSFVRAG